MANAPDPDEVPAVKVARLRTDFSLCLVCQNKTAETLVSKPTGHDQLLTCVRDRGTYGDGAYPEINRRLGPCTAEELASSGASWHRKCYQETVHKGMCQRAKARYDQNLTARRGSSAIKSSVSGTFTRSQSTPFNKNVCFFCNEAATERNKLHEVETFNAGSSLKEAIEKSDDKELKVKLCTAIDDGDAHAIDIKYHKRCWAQHVTNVLRKKTDMPETHSAAAEILLEGSMPSMASLQTAYVSIQMANDVQEPNCDRRQLRQMIESKIPDVEFHKAKRVNESDRVSIKASKDAAISMADDVRKDDNEDMNILYKAAAVLRYAIKKADRWNFSGSFTVTDNQMPKELYSFFRWVLQGPNTSLSIDQKSAQVNRRAISLAQSTVSSWLSDRQVSNRKSNALKQTREMPQQLAIGLAIRQAIRSKRIVNMLHGFGVTVRYERLLRVETQLANAVTQRMLLNGNVYLPPDFVHGKHVYFAVDNIDFAEDTPDGKHTLHATAMAIYQ